MLTLTQWDRYELDIGNNRELPKAERVFLEVERGLSVRQREAFSKALGEALGVLGVDDDALHKLAAVLSMHLRWGGVPLRWEGGEVTTLEGYARLVFVELALSRYTQELLRLALRANSWDSEAAQLFERPSGTALGTGMTGLPPPTV
jgi:hypothetical protein